ncbi:MAG TPA: glutamate-5-semialdehyde dehydrogenase [Candidatus Omnitrophota bacterium]|nr:glutamate-5-semialdehyde dehydrogenase [Candidatus Omnitrophota bacterium]
MTNNRFKQYAKGIAGRARQASFEMANLSAKAKNKILFQVAGALRREKAFLLKENSRDVFAGRKAGLSSSLLDRLTLNEKRIEDMAASLEAVAKLRDPAGEVIERWKRPNGLRISKVRVPLGVILIIYEARPNVTQECAGLCIKSGNSVILRGGREAFYSNKAIANLFRKVLRSNRVSPDGVILVERLDYEIVDELLKRQEEVNLAIPRGGEALIRRVVATARIPVIKHYKGVCHVYVDRSADMRMATEIAFNAKCQRPSVCNSMETLLVHRGIAKKFLPLLVRELKSVKCEIRGCAETCRIIPEAKKATERDWYEEYLDYILAVRVVRSVDEAARHIRKYGSAHTDAIVTRTPKNAERFVQLVDSSSVMVNTTTRFSDGFQYGFGAEIGISTDKIHARGPMGLEGLTSYKYVVEGNGQLRQ